MLFLVFWNQLWLQWDYILLFKKIIKFGFCLLLIEAFYLLDVTAPVSVGLKPFIRLFSSNTNRKYVDGSDIPVLHKKQETLWSRKEVSFSDRKQRIAMILKDSTTQ